MKTKPIKIRGRHGGPRPNSGRKPKPDKANWAQVTCFLRRDTIERLRASATPPDAPLDPNTGKVKLRERFGKYLQWHLDRYPPISYELWQLELKYDAKEAARRAAAPPPKKRISRTDRAILKELRDALKVKKAWNSTVAK
jgi:hypothetical protein